jgi:hypothetical protein
MLLLLIQLHTISSGEYKGISLLNPKTGLAVLEFSAGCTTAFLGLSNGTGLELIERLFDMELCDGLKTSSENESSTRIEGNRGRMVSAYSLRHQLKVRRERMMYVPLLDFIFIDICEELRGNDVKGIEEVDDMDADGKECVGADCRAAG